MGIVFLDETIKISGVARLLGFCVMLFSLANCTSDHGKGFEMMPPDETGISFNNQITESDTLNAAINPYIYNGGGVGIADINNDGLPDIFFAGNLVPSRLYLNKGNMHFEDITAKAGISQNRWATGVSMVDINTDGLMDIYVCVAGSNFTNHCRNLLYINQGNNTFKEEAAAYGLDDPGYSTQAAFFDYDLDGDLDVYLLTNGLDGQNYGVLRPRKTHGESITTDRLYRNNGHHTFTNVSKEAGINIEGYGLGVGILDINKDGWPDVYCANDFISNDLLWVNNGDGTFTESLGKYFSQTSQNGMGLDIADYNNDGLEDLAETDMLPGSNAHHKMVTRGNTYGLELRRAEQGYSTQFVRNTLQLQIANGKFGEIGRLAGISKTDWSWAPLFVDMDNDGLLDLFITNGYGKDVTNLDYVVMSHKPNNPFGTLESRRKEVYEGLAQLGTTELPNHLFRNEGHLAFSDQTDKWNAAVPGISNGVVYVDLDLDGDMDLVTNNINSPAGMYRNLVMDGNKKERPHYLHVLLHGSHENPIGIGASVWLYAGQVTQQRQQYLARGYLSSVDPALHFGLGKSAHIDSLKVTWPDGKFQTLRNVPVDQDVTLDYKNAKNQKAPQADGTSKKALLFQDVSGQFPVVHKENDYVDFKDQPLLLKMVSREGPGLAVGDVNGDGLEDFFMSAALGDTSFTWLQQRDGKFKKGNPLPSSWNFEGLGALLLDIDNDGDLDLYVTSGGNAYPASRPGQYQDRVYLNDGKGNFTWAKDRLPAMNSSTASAAACDFDRDGDLDIFVGSRIDPHQYPKSGKSYLLRNDGGKFTDVTDRLLPKDANLGMVTSAIWSDFDNDGLIDLIVTGEWMPVTFLKNDGKHFVNVTDKTGLLDKTGFWNSIAGVDYDLDGDIDYVVGNLGENSAWAASASGPINLVAKDFDNNGTIDPVMGYYVQGKEYPWPTRDALVGQLGFMAKRFPTYADYAQAMFGQLFTKEELEGALKLQVTELRTSLLENLGEGKFALKPLPVMAQLSPVYGISTDDINNDGLPDLVLTGNRSDTETVSGYLDASIGAVALGDGHGGFHFINADQSGWYTPGEMRGIARLMRQDTAIYLAACNNGPLKAFDSKRDVQIMPLNPGDVYAIITDQDGRTRKTEFYYGSGYLGQSSRTLAVGKNTKNVVIYNYRGESREAIGTVALQKQ